MDDIDRANQHAARMLAANLAKQVGKGRYQGMSLHQCEECDDPSPRPVATMCRGCACASPARPALNGWPANPSNGHERHAS